MRKRIEDLAANLAIKFGIGVPIKVEEVSEDIIMNIVPMYSQESLSASIDALMRFRREELKVDAYILTFNRRVMFKMSLSDDEMEALIAHEFGHILNNDFSRRSMRIRAGLNRLIMSVFFTMLLSFMMIGEGSMSLKAFAFLSGMYAVYFLIFLGIMWFMRKQEYLADLFSAKNTGLQQMLSVLNKIKKFHMERNPKFVDAWRRSLFVKLFLSHPCYSNREFFLRNNLEEQIT